MMETKYKPILFTYDISVFGRRCDWYLTLRGFKYAQCIQPNRMPRPDLEHLGIAYRRIPILAIGRDIYCDSQLIIEKLERMYPANRLGSTNPFEHGLERVVQSWIIHGGPFWRTSALIPPDVGVMLEQEWTDDRQEMVGRPFNREVMANGRSDGYAHMRSNFGLIEHGLLGDGRKFIFATEKPTLIDIHAIWPFDWAIGESMQMGKHLDPDMISEPLYPRVYAWVNRFRKAIIEAEQKTGPPETVSSEDAVKMILEAGFSEKDHLVDELDPLKLKKGQMVKVYPTDTGFNHQDKGKLLSLDKREVVIESKVKDGDGYLRLHFPRINFKIEPIDDAD